MIILYEAFVSDLLRKPKVNGGSTIVIVEAKTTLTRVCEVPLTGSAPLG